jgi:hypothetical protein
MPIMISTSTPTPKTSETSMPTKTESPKPTMSETSISTLKPESSPAPEGQWWKTTAKWETYQKFVRDTTKWHKNPLPYIRDIVNDIYYFSNDPRTPKIDPNTCSNVYLSKELVTNNALSGGDIPKNNLMLVS